jgi:hypothetical protein
MRVRTILPMILIMGCSQTPTAPSAASRSTQQGNAEGPVTTTGFSIAALTADVKNGPITIERVRVSIDGAPRFYAQPGETYSIQPGVAVSLWIEWAGDTALVSAPRLVVEWGAEERDNIHCGPCLLTHQFKDGLHPVTVRMDDRAGGVTTRTFFLDTRPISELSKTVTVIAGELTALDPFANGSLPLFVPFAGAENHPNPGC